MSELILPGTFRPQNAQLSTKIVFYRHVKTGRIMMGCPEQFPAPKGFEKIVCATTQEAERWSERLRSQDNQDEKLSEYERECIEGPLREYARQELQHRMANARNNLNREFCRYALEQLDLRAARGKTIRESYLHVEAFEEGH